MMNQTTMTRPAQRIIEASATTGGGTFTLDGRPVESGVAVGVETIWTGPALTEEVIDYARMHVEFSGMPGSRVGTWYDEENQRWEVQETIVSVDRLNALRVARSHGERYVYDIDADECVAVA